MSFVLTLLQIAAQEEFVSMFKSGLRFLARTTRGLARHE